MLAPRYMKVLRKVMVAMMLVPAESPVPGLNGWRKAAAR
jgi:hypothetical protein